MKRLIPERMGWLREEESLRGRLLGPVNREGTSYLILFPYSMDNVRTLRKGQMVAVRNFSSTSPSYTILEITASRPVHYALGLSTDKLESAYPGFLLEAAKSVAQDWEQHQPAEEVTRIRAEATPTGLQIISSESGMKVTPDDSLPMQGGECIPLTPVGTERIVNYAIDEANSICVGNLIVAPEVRVRAMPQKLVVTHAGVFGFTGTGKSNLLSTLISELVEVSRRGSFGSVKIVLLDYMAEYFPLLADIFHKCEGAILLFLGLKSLPGGDSAVDILLGREPHDFAQLLLYNTTIPDRLRERGDVMAGLVKVLEKVISQGRLKIGGESFQEMCKVALEEVLQEYPPLRLGKAYGALQKLIKVAASLPSPEAIQQLADEMRSWAEKRKVPAKWGPPQFGLPQISGWVEDIPPTAQECLEKMRERLGEVASRAPDLKRLQEAGVLLPLDTIVNILNEKEETSLILVLSEDPDKLRQFFSELVDEVYHSRRSCGQSQPPCLFVVDEADEFLPQEAKDTYSMSRRAAETLARRGRKFGLGLWIATQRVAYLDTKTIGQLHTYFVSKLPRKYDRERIAEAYGISQDTIDKCLELKTGEWFLASHSATGLRGVPIPIRAPNAEERIENFVKNMGR